MASSEIISASAEGRSPNRDIAAQQAVDNAKIKIEEKAKEEGYDIITQNSSTTIDNVVESEGNFIVSVTVSAEVVKKEKPKEATTSDQTDPGVFEIESEAYPPDNKTEIPPDPVEVTEQTQLETEKKEEQQQVSEVSTTTPEVTEKNTPPDLKAKGQEKLAQVINNKRSDLKRLLIPLIIGLATAIGIKALNSLKPQAPETCPTPEELNNLIAKRNKIVDKLNNIVKIIDALSKVLIGVGLVLSVLSILVKTLKNVRKILSVASKAVPAPPGIPGAVSSGLNDLKDNQEKIVEKLFKIGAAVLGIGLALALFNELLMKIIKLLKPIDAYLEGCNTDNNAQLTPLDPILLQLEQINNDINKANEDTLSENYNGFALEIVEEQFTPTVTRRKAVAKNSQGIILLETPFSFTTENQVLLDQLKLLIESNNLEID